MGNVIYFKQEGAKKTADGERSLWEENCLPIGNGYLGATFFGGVREESITLNEKSLWAGGPCARRGGHPSARAGTHRRARRNGRARPGDRTDRLCRRLHDRDSYRTWQQVHGGA